MIKLRLRNIDAPPLPNMTQVITLASRYQFTPVVDLISRAVSESRRLRLRAEDGELIMIDPDLLQTIAVREER